MSVNITKDVSSPFSRCCSGWEADSGHGVVALQHVCDVTENEVDGALSYSRAE